MNDNQPAPALVAHALAQVPTHRQAHVTTQVMSETVTRAAQGVSDATAHATVQVTLKLLDALGALSWQETGARARDQVGTYLIQSLQWYAQHDMAFVTNLMDTPRDELSAPEAGVALARRDLLRRMEERRVQVAHKLGIQASPARKQDAALVLLSEIVSDQPCLLFQWDERAGQYQLIGGRIEPGETPLAAAIRECHEELGPSQACPWQHGQDFTLTPVTFVTPVTAPSSPGVNGINSVPPDAIELLALSPTYGALTHYRFFFFHATLSTKVMLGTLDRWIPIAHIQDAASRSQLRLGNGELYTVLDHALAGGLGGIVPSAGC